MNTHDELYDKYASDISTLQSKLNNLFFTAKRSYFFFNEKGEQVQMSIVTPSIYSPALAAFLELLPFMSDMAGALRRHKDLTDNENNGLGFEYHNQALHHSFAGYYDVSEMWVVQFYIHGRHQQFNIIVPEEHARVGSFIRSVEHTPRGSIEFFEVKKDLVDVLLYALFETGILDSRFYRVLAKDTFFINHNEDGITLCFDAIKNKHPVSCKFDLKYGDFVAVYAGQMFFTNPENKERLIRDIGSGNVLLETIDEDGINGSGEAVYSD